MRRILKSKMQTPRSIKGIAQTYRLGLERVPVLPPRMTLGEETIGTECRSEGDVKINVAHGVPIGHIAMWSNREFPRSDDSDAGEGLVSVAYSLRSRSRFSGKVREEVLDHGQGVQKRYAECEDEIVVVLVEGSTLLDVQERTEETTLVLDRMFVESRQILDAERFSQYVVQGIGLNVEEEGSLIPQRRIGHVGVARDGHGLRDARLDAKLVHDETATVFPTLARLGHVRFDESPQVLVEGGGLRAALGVFVDVVAEVFCEREGLLLSVGHFGV